MGRNEYQTIKIWKRTLDVLRVLAAMEGKSMVEIIDCAVQKERDTMNCRHCIHARPADTFGYKYCNEKKEYMREDGFCMRFCRNTDDSDCRNSDCRYHSERFDQNCGAELVANGDPAVTVCQKMERL